MWWTAPAPGDESPKVIVATNHMREPSTCRLPRSVWISRRTFSRFTASMRPRRSWSGNNFAAVAFFEALPPCLVGMEACASAHYWARELRKLGHEVRLMPAKDVKAYVKRNKNDAVDAEASCEAVRRPTMRFVQVKSAEQQGRLMQHRTRDLLLRQRTQVINALRAHLAVGLWRRKDARGSSSCWRSLRTKTMNACRSTRVRV